MRYVWEEKDIRGGRRAKAPGNEDFIIGYSYKLSPKQLADQVYFLVAVDGFVSKVFESKQFLADYLNERNIAPVDFWDK
jgi:hypothetical protein